MSLSSFFAFIIFSSNIIFYFQVKMQKSKKRGVASLPQKLAMSGSKYQRWIEKYME